MQFVHFVHFEHFVTLRHMENFFKYCILSHYHNLGAGLICLRRKHIYSPTF